MLTVKHILWDGGFETLYQAKEVRMKRRDPQCSPRSLPEPIEFVVFDCPNGDLHSLYAGTVYVMNEAGRTVAKYEITSDANQQASSQPTRFSMTTAPDGSTSTFTQAA
jgi:hypothetical protein